MLSILWIELDISLWIKIIHGVYVQDKGIINHLLKGTYPVLFPALYY